MSNSNPLQQYFRQPKIYISLPSKGLYYPPGCFQGDYNQVPIMSMTGMDEIIMKTPDALFNGEAAIKVIESCCPYIKNAKNMPSIDVDTLLVAIRVATFGKILNVIKNCNHCNHENEYELDLENVVNHFTGLKFVNDIRIDDTLSINVRPLTYEQANYFSLENFKLQKTMAQTPNIKDEEEKIQIVNQVFTDVSELQLTLYLASIESVKTGSQTVTDQQFILEWLKNMERDTYNVIKEKLEENKRKWDYPEQSVKCGNCGGDNTVAPILDQTNFFG